MDGFKARPMDFKNAGMSSISCQGLKEGPILFIWSTPRKSCSLKGNPALSDVKMAEGLRPLHRNTVVLFTL